MDVYHYIPIAVASVSLAVNVGAWMLLKYCLTEMTDNLKSLKKANSQIKRFGTECRRLHTENQELAIVARSMTP